jgi:predicted glycogen debranching enzyme
MSYLEFDKSQLINLNYSLGIEMLRTNRAGSFSNTTIICCNTRKYHGLLICPMENLDGDNHVLLSSLDETVIQHDRHFHLAVHMYPGVVHPGHKYIREFENEPIATIIYRVGGVLLKKEMLLVENVERVLIRYTLLEAHSPTKLWLHPFLAFRNVHSLSKANMDVSQKYEQVENGIKTKMYHPYPFLYLQISKKSEYVSAPDWFYNVEYIEELKRGYAGHEDLFVPGFFEVDMKTGESIVFSAGLTETNTKNLNKDFNTEIKKRTPRNSYANCLENSAQQFIMRNKTGTEIIAGYPWFDRCGRDTFISLPGLTICRNELDTCSEVLDTMSKTLKNGLFIKTGKLKDDDRSSVDAPLWYFWAIQKYAERTGDYSTIWKKYGDKLKKILDAYKTGTQYNIKMQSNGLIYAGYDGIALTWMGVMINGQPLTPRTGMAVEVNALWYNAVQFALELAKKAKDKKFISEWEELPALIEKSYTETFWNDQKGYLADYVNGNYKDWSVRPNQIFAASLPYSPIDEVKRHAVTSVVQNELLTPRGLRTLSPNNPEYKGTCDGDVISRDKSYHQGTAWPWLLGAFCEAYLKLYGKSAVRFVRDLYSGFEEEMKTHGIGSISELYDGDPPYKANGAISQAWSVAEILRIKYLADKFESTI